MVLHKWAGSGGWYWNHHGTAQVGRFWWVVLEPHGTAQVGALVGGTGTTLVLHMCTCGQA